MPAPIYTYTPNTPQASQPFDQSQPEILGNFQAINELINVNHIGFNTPDTFGKHNFISMPDQVTAPTTSATEVAMYSQATPAGSNASELFIKYPENGSTTGITEQFSDITNTVTPNGTSGGTASQGWCTFPSGVTFRWGSFSVQGTKSTSVTYASGPLYTNYSYNGATSPTASGDPINVSLLINGYQNDSGFSSAIYYGASTSVTTSFNYLMMGI